MKRITFVFGLAAVAASTALPAATVSVSSFKGTVYGPGEATLAFTDVDAEQELWVAWDDADKGADISQWKESERLDTIASGTTSATYRLPDDARSGRAARFFLLDGGAASDPLDLTAARSEDVFADAYIWMRGMAIDKNGNHILDDKIGEITNSLHTVALSTGSYGAAGHKPVISNEFVRLPGRGVGRQMQTLYFPQDVVWTNETQTLGYVTPCAVTCGTPLTNFVSHYTWIIRFRPDFSAPVLDTQWLLGFGYGSSRGMMFGLAETSTERRKLQVHTYNSSWDLGESFVISNGCGWVDFAVTVDGQKVTAYLVKDGPTTPDGNTDIGLLKRASQTYTNTVNLVPNPGTVLRFGTESPQNGKTPGLYHGILYRNRSAAHLRRPPRSSALGLFPFCIL